MNRPWTLEGLAAAHLFTAANTPIAAIAEALGRTTQDVDLALWRLMGRDPKDALEALNRPQAARSHRSRLLLRFSLLELIASGRAETRQLAQRLGENESAVLSELRLMADEGLVDASEPPPPRGDEALCWFLKSGAAA